MEEKKTTSSESAQRSLANLKPFEEGVSGNPLGRKLGSKNKKTIFQEVLRARGLDDSNPMMYLFNKFVDVLEGDETNPAVIKATVSEVMDRIDGKVPAKVEHTRTKDELNEAAGDLLEVFNDAEDVEIIEK